MTPDHLARLTKLRQHLHSFPEVSGFEKKTSHYVTDYLSKYHPDKLITQLGGHGVAAVFEGKAQGPTVLFRAELDGLPIPEQSDKPYRSQHDGCGHLCGHDGHMTMVLALAEELAENRPESGRVVLLFQPAEETGQGAAAVVADPRFHEIAPDYAFSLHNVPGLASGKTALSVGPANCASRGVKITLNGRTSHAAAPQDGLSPARAISQLMSELVALGNESAPLNEDYALVTLTHVQLGEPTFGVAPGVGTLWVTLRTVSDARMARLVSNVEQRVTEVAQAEELTVTLNFDDIFAACDNNIDASDILKSAAFTVGYDMDLWGAPQRWSEDFGVFGQGAKSAMFWLGSGETQPQLHNPDYDFPDEILPVGITIFRQIIQDLLNPGDAGAHLP